MNDANLSWSEDALRVLVPAHLWPGLDLLVRAYVYARRANRSTWQFAVELASLKDAGLDETDLRFLVSLGYAEHEEETFSNKSSQRCFRPCRRGNFTARTAFVLTETGTALFGAQRALGGRTEIRTLPHYDPETREIRVVGRLVKRFRQPASGQEAVLRAFEVNGWPPVLDDPLPPLAGRCPQRRLHDTVNNLNRNQRQTLLHFFVTGNGRRLGWQLLCGKQDTKATGELHQS